MKCSFLLALRAKTQMILHMQAVFFQLRESLDTLIQNVLRRTLYRDGCPSLQYESTPTTFKMRIMAGINTWCEKTHTLCHVFVKQHLKISWQLLCYLIFNICFLKQNCYHTIGIWSSFSQKNRQLKQRINLHLSWIKNNEECLLLLA